MTNIEQYSIDRYCSFHPYVLQCESSFGFGTFVNKTATSPKPFIYTYTLAVVETLLSSVLSSLLPHQELLT